MRSIPGSIAVVLERNTEIDHLYDVELQGLADLAGCSSAECHLVVYPYSRRISSANIALNPFEEYVKDIASLQKSAYTRVTSEFNKLFGLLLGALITIVFICCKPEELVSVESIVSILAAFFIGKDLWDDIDRMLVDLTRAWPLRLQESYYSYRLERGTTMALYSALAKRRRYGQATVLPTKMDFISQSNSQTVRMWFEGRDLRALGEPQAHILSIAVDPASLTKELEQAGYLFGVKLSLSRRVGPVTVHTELFQSLDKGQAGCLELSGKWVPGGAFYRLTVTIGRVKLFLRSGVVGGVGIVKFGAAG